MFTPIFRWRRPFATSGDIRPEYPFSNRAWRWLPVVALLGAFALPAVAATVSGTITIPTSDGGYRADLIGAKVRVEGTNLVATVATTTDKYNGSFSIADVPTGSVTLMYVEPSGDDSFTFASRRRTLNVTGDVTDAGFDLQYHWRFWPGTRLRGATRGT